MPMSCATEILSMARAEFGERELVELTMVVIAIKDWNHTNVAFRTPPGTYRARAQKADE